MKKFVTASATLEKIRAANASDVDMSSPESHVPPATASEETFLRDLALVEEVFEGVDVPEPDEKSHAAFLKSEESEE